MRFSLWPNPMSPWPDLLALCRHAEETGWDGLWYADHFMPAGRNNGGPVNESWTAVAGLAASVPRLRIGHLVNGNTYRHPAVLAKMAAGVDHVSGGRYVLGLGAGWQENEHRAYGIPLGSTAERLARLEEACQVVTGLLRRERVTLAGRFYQLEEAPLNPKPLQERLPLLIGGGGERVTLRIAARYADEWNVWGAPELLEHKMAVLDRHCVDVGRDPGEVQRSAVALIDFGDEKQPALPLPATIGGSTGELRRAVEGYRASGVHELVVPDFNLGFQLDERRRLLDRFREDVIRPLA